MSDRLSELNEDDVRQLGFLIERLENSTFDFLQIQVGELKVTLSKGGPPAAVGEVGGARMATGPGATPAPVNAAPPPPPPVAPAPLAARPPASDGTPGTIAIRAPIIGVFYAQAEPGAPPFVTLGAEVTETTTVALIEVMKTFNAIPAGVRGTVVEICTENSQLVEYGQVLYRVRPAS